MAIQPIFIFSAVRSGSTLLQRIVAAHDGVATTAEPWLLMPLASTLRRTGIDGSYLHSLTVDAIEDFCEQLPGGRDQYVDGLRELALRLYEQAAGESARWFVDKSPPYCFLAPEIIRVFPDAKFVFLWRNPLSIVSSIIDTWQPWQPTLFREDLFVGVPRLVAAYTEHRAKSYSVRFEDLLSGEESHWTGLMEYLQIEFEPDALSRFSEIELAGRMGDPTGAKRYSALSDEPEQKWKSTIANPLRKAWCRRYLTFLGRERLAIMGYDIDRLLSELDSVPTSTDHLAADLQRLVKDVAKEPIRLRARGGVAPPVNVIRELLRAKPGKQTASDPQAPPGRQAPKASAGNHEIPQTQKNGAPSGVVRRVDPIP